MPVDLGYTRDIAKPAFSGGTVTGVIAPGPRLVADPPLALWTHGSGRALLGGPQLAMVGSRNPSPQELATCAPYLARQVALVQPKVILVMGRFAVQSLLKDSVPQVESVPLGKLRGQIEAAPTA